MPSSRLNHLNINPDQLTSEAVTTGFIPNLKAGFNFGMVSGMAGEDSKAHTEMQIWGPIVKELNKITGNDFKNPAVSLIGFFDAPFLYEEQKNKIYSYIKNNKDILPEGLQNLNDEEINLRSRQIYQDNLANLEELQEYNPGLLYGGSRLMGQIGSFVANPMSSIYALAPTFAAKKILTQITGNALVGGGISLFDEPEIKDWMNELGEEYGIKEMTTNLAVNMALGGFIPILGRSVSLSLTQTKKLYNILDKKKVLTPAQKSEIEEIIENLDTVNNNPLEKPADQSEVFAKAENETRLIKTENALNENRTPDISELPSSPIKDSFIKDSAEIKETIPLSPNQINVEAKKFQFKESDELGVTDRLQGVKKWDNYQAGLVSVYKYSDETFSIADGHQRLALAKRIMKEDPGQDIKLNAYVFDEADGWTIPQVRALAAVKNIAEGTGTVLDAVKVLRIDPSRLDNLPPRSQLVMQAREIIKLSEDAYGSFVNGVIPANYAAVIGRLIDDKALHADAVTILAKADPPNVFQAESIVRQIKNAGREEIEQISLFGDEIVSKSLYAERAKILDRTFKELKTDKKSFENLLKNAETLEQEGNVLVQDLNQKRANIDGQAIAILQAVANRKGPLSDKLNEAAKLASETGNYSTAVRGFVQDVRGSMESGDFGRISDGELGRIVDDPATRSGSEIEAESNVKDFDDPNGQGSIEQTRALENNLFGEEVIPSTVPIKSFDEKQAILKESQPVKTVDDIYALADESQTFIAKIGKEIENDLGVTFVNPGIKNIGTTKEKMFRKKYNTVQEITDVARGGFKINKAQDADAIAARFAKDLEILDEGWVVQPTGYFDRKILIKTPNGIVAEIQIWSPQLYDAKFNSNNRFKKSGTDLYIEQRKTIDVSKKLNLLTQQKIIYSEALSKENQSFVELFGRENFPKDPSNLARKSSSVDITPPVLKTSSASTEIQSPPGRTIATASNGDIDIAGRPSQLTNIIKDTSESKISTLSEDVNLDLEVPINETQTVTLRQLTEELNQEDAMIKRMEFCVR